MVNIHGTKKLIPIRLDARQTVCNVLRWDFAFLPSLLMARLRVYMKCVYEGRFDEVAAYNEHGSEFLVLLNEESGFIRTGGIPVPTHT